MLLIFIFRVVPKNYKLHVNTYFSEFVFNGTVDITLRIHITIVLLLHNPPPPFFFPLNIQGMSKMKRRIQRE